MKTYRTDTLLGHLGRDRERFEGAVNPPVYRTSTVLFDSLEAYEDRARYFEKGRLNYGRYGTPTTFALQDAVAALEGGHGCLAVGSGLAAIAGTLLAFLEAGDHILVSDSVYRPTRTFCGEVLARLGVETEYFDPMIGSAIAGRLRETTRLVFLETPGTGTFEVADTPAIARAARDRGVRLVMDTTWAGSLLCRPFELGADVSIQAGTKYIVGHSDAMLGLITYGEDCEATLRRGVWNLGYGIGPDDAYLALRGLRTLSLRLARHEETGLRLARWLAERPEVERVLHPALPGHPGHEAWRRDFAGACGLFGLVLREPCPPEAVAAMVDGMALFGIGASWGGYESLMVAAHPEQSRSATRWDAPGRTLRLHAGLEDPEDLIADLEAGLARLRAAAGKAGAP